jgi:hypothetical protein
MCSVNPGSFWHSFSFPHQKVTFYPLPQDMTFVLNHLGHNNGGDDFETWAPAITGETFIEIFSLCRVTLNPEPPPILFFLHACCSACGHGQHAYAIRNECGDVGHPVITSELAKTCPNVVAKLGAIEEWRVSDPAPFLVNLCACFLHALRLSPVCFLHAY